MRTELLVFCLLPGLAWPAVYKCEENGLTTFSQHPCSDNPETVEVEYRRAPLIQDEEIGQSQTRSVDEYVKERRHQRKIRQLEGRRTALQQERDTKLAGLEAEIRHATASHIYNAIRRDMRQVRREYGEKIRHVEADLRRVRANPPK